MKAGPEFAWRQLVAQKGHFSAALAGVAFAVTLMLGQIGLRDSLLSTATRLYSHLKADIVMTSWEYQFSQNAPMIPRRRIDQARAVRGVASCSPLQVGWLSFENPINRQASQIVMLGFRPDDDIFDFPGQTIDFRALRRPLSLIFDANSRSVYGPVAAIFRARNRLEVTASGQTANIVGLLRLGPGFGNNGYVFASDGTFAALSATGSLPSIGAIRLEPGADLRSVLEGLRSSLPKDVRFVPRNQFLEAEEHYWLAYSPIGFVFTAGLILGIVVGSVVVYQILYSDVTSHLAEYATMKAMGYSDTALFRVVVMQAIFMSVLGFIPGALMAQVIYVVTRNATMLPLELTAERLAEVYALTLAMCSASGVLAMHALKAADPAEIF